MRSLGCLALALAAGGPLAACSLNQEGVSPNRDEIMYPSGALTDPGGRWLYVVNSNSDLRFNDGTLVAIDLDLARADASGAGGVPPWDDCPSFDYTQVHPRGNTQTSYAGGENGAINRYCCHDLLDRNVLNCDDRGYIPQSSSVRIGSFGAGIEYQRSCRPAGARCAMDPCEQANGRLFIGVRGNTSITWVDVVPGTAQGAVPTLSCGGSGGFPECDLAHRVSTTPLVTGRTSTPLPDEPYALRIDEERQFLYVGHLRGDTSRANTGTISLFDVAEHGPPIYRNTMQAIFPADGNGLFGVTSLTLDKLAGSSNTILATSRYLPRVGGARPNREVAECSATADSLVLVPTADVFDTGLSGTETRGIQILPYVRPTDPNESVDTRAFVLQRNPPALIAFDVELTLGSMTRVVPTAILETCTGPTFLQSYDTSGNSPCSEPGATCRLFVTCFDQGQTYVFDPYVPRLIDIVNVGAGPAGLAFGGPNNRDRAYVVGFSANNVSVLDLDETSPTFLRVVQRIGIPSPTPR